MKLKSICLLMLSGLLLSGCVSKKYVPLPQEYLDDRKTYSEVNQLFGDAMNLTKPPDNSGKPFDMPKEQQAQIISKLEQGVALSKKIDDNFLNYLDPEFKSHYRNEYVRGNELILEGLNGDTTDVNSLGVKKQFEGSQLIGIWNKWWEAKRDDIINKAFAE